MARQIRTSSSKLWGLATRWSDAGDIRWEASRKDIAAVSGPLFDAVVVGDFRTSNNHCHCSMCRKVHGAAFGSFLHADAQTFRWLAGRDLVQQFQSSADNLRAFCKICGSNMPVLEDNDTHVIIPAGALDSDPGVRPVVHIHVASKAAWYDIHDSLPQFPEFPPQEFWTKE